MLLALCADPVCLNLVHGLYGIINNIRDWANIAVNITIIIWRYCRQKSLTRLELLELETFDKYIKPLPLMIWDRILMGLNLFNVLLLTARALKYFQVTKGGRRLMRSVNGATPEVMSFVPIYSSVIVGYSFAGHMLYGLNFTEWATFPRAFFRVFELNFGLYHPGLINRQGGIFSAIFIHTGNILESNRAKEQEQFSRTLGFADILFLMAMKESHVDALINVVIQPKADRFITRNILCKVWDKLDDDKVPEWTVRRVLGWYWDRDDLAGAWCLLHKLYILPFRSCCILSFSTANAKAVGFLFKNACCWHCYSGF
ncbi:putative polycystin cation channel, PKD1/PKD2 [Plasmopara halstedii]